MLLIKCGRLLLRNSFEIEFDIASNNILADIYMFFVNNPKLLLAREILLTNDNSKPVHIIDLGINNYKTEDLYVAVVDLFYSLYRYLKIDQSIRYTANTFLYEYNTIVLGLNNNFSFVKLSIDQLNILIAGNPEYYKQLQQLSENYDTLIYTCYIYYYVKTFTNKSIIFNNVNIIANKASYVIDTPTCHQFALQPNLRIYEDITIDDFISYNKVAKSDSRIDSNIAKYLSTLHSDNLYSINLVPNEKILCYHNKKSINRRTKLHQDLTVHLMPSIIKKDGCCS